MAEKNNFLLTSGSISDNYQEVLYWKVTENKSRVIAINIFGVLLSVIFGSIFSSIAVSFGKLYKFRFGLIEIGLVFIAVVLTIILHELTHGLFIRIFGARPKFGILWKGMMFYATSTGYAFQRNKYLVIALAPFVLISLLLIVGMWLLQGTVWVALLGICGTLNASGAIGDMWITVIVLRYASEALIIDERDGVRVFLSKP